MTERRFLKMLASDERRIREALLRPCGREHKLYAEVNRSGAGFILSRLFIPGERDYAIRTPVLVQPTPEWMAGRLVDFRLGDADGVVEIHSHPFTGDAWFSGTDDAYIDAVREDFERQKAGATFLRMVVGQRREGFSLELFDRGLGRFAPLDALSVVGENGVEKLTSHGSRFAQDAAADEAYSRCAALRTMEEHSRIRNARLVIIGAGGIGWAAAHNASLLGVRHLTLVDADLVEDVNLNRLFGATPEDAASSVPKVERLAAILRAQDPSRTIDVIVERFPSPRSVKAAQGADLVVCGVDHPPTRLKVQQVCAANAIPALDLASSIYLDEAKTREDERHAHAWLYVPGGPCWMQMGLAQQPLESDSSRAARRAVGYVVDDPRHSPGSVQTLNNTIAGVGMSLAEAYLLGRKPRHDVVLYEERFTPDHTIRLKTFRCAADARCLICGDEGILGQGGDPFDTERMNDLEAPPLPEILEAGAA